MCFEIKGLEVDKISILYANFRSLGVEIGEIGITTKKMPTMNVSS